MLKFQSADLEKALIFFSFLMIVDVSHIWIYAWFYCVVHRIDLDWPWFVLKLHVKQCPNGIDMIFTTSFPPSSNQALSRLCN